MKKFLAFVLVGILAVAVCGTSSFAATAPTPTVSITAPTNGATVSGTQVLISANCTSGGSNATISKVTYRIDSGSEVTMSGPSKATNGTWTAYWDSTKVANGNHTITVKVTNSAKKTASQSITVNVQNGGGTNPHANLNWADYPGNCYSCHAAKFTEFYQSLHYQ